MKLQIYRPLKHISPSSLSEWMLCPTKFYLKRLSQHNWQPDPQGKPAAVGTAFDCYVKAEFARRLGLPYNIQEELKKGVEHADCIDLGKSLANKYIRWGFIDKRLEEGLVDIHFESRQDFLIDNEVIHILGYPDARFSNGTMLDFKVSGALSSTGASPKPGYLFRCVDGVHDYVSHHKAQEPLELIDEDWARQQVIYNLFTFGKPVERLPVAIDQVSIRGNKVTISEIRTHVTLEFQNQVLRQIRDCWVKANEGEIEEAQPAPARCMMYNQLCSVANLCTAYTSMNEMVRSMKGFKSQ